MVVGFRLFRRVDGTAPPGNLGTAKIRGRTAIRNRSVTFFLFLGAILSGMLIVPSRALGQEPSEPAAPQQQQQPPAQTPAQTPAAPPQQQSPAPSSTPGPSPQNPNQPGLTEKERKNIEREKETGTSQDRIFWTLPNFLTMENAGQVPPLTAGQKFKTVGRGLIDPSEFVLQGFVAGLGQASNSNPSYGQGAQGYAKRYGTAYADNAIENFMASAVLPSVLHQDPRYYQLGHGGFSRRTLHALSRVFVTRSDSGNTQFNYSETFGAAIAATISTYTYHPQSERGFGNVASTWSTQIGYDAGTYMLKEFWPDLRKLHHKHPQPDPPTQTPQP